MENVINSLEGIFNGLVVSDIADVELQLSGMFRILLLILMTHVVLFLFITREDPDLPDIAVQKSFGHSVAKRSGTACYQ